MTEREAGWYMVNNSVDSSAPDVPAEWVPANEHWWLEGMRRFDIHFTKIGPRIPDPAALALMARKAAALDWLEANRETDILILNDGIDRNGKTHRLYLNDDHSKYYEGAGLLEAIEAAQSEAERGRDGEA